MASSPLLEDYTVKLIDESQVPDFIPKDPISRYNYVIEAYNTESNRNGNDYLYLMMDSSFYKCIYSMMNNFFGEVLLIIIMIFLPIINIFTFILVLWTFMFYQKFLALYKKNEKIVEDPFKNMVYSPEMCESINKINWFFQLQFEGFLLIKNKNNK